MKLFRFLLIGLAALCVQAGSASAITISLVYQDPADPFFNAQAQATLNKAAADVSFAITSTLAALSQDVYVGTNGGASVTLDWALTYKDPATASLVTVNTFNLALNEVLIAVGSRNIDGTDGILGEGGPGGASFSVNPTGSGTERSVAFQNVQAASNAVMPRGGPRVNTTAGNFNFGSGNEPFSLDFGYALSSLALDSTENWNFDYAVLPTATQNDLYSVAMHEILHDLGFGTGASWLDQINGDGDWLGANAIGLLGTGVGVLSENGDHLAGGLTGRPLIDGAFQFALTQEALMSPTLTMGTRKYITDLDLAFLKDMGWNVVAVPEPSSALLLGMGLTLILVIRRSTCGVKLAQKRA